ncbi:MAG: class I SAM-dependent methyltransferase [Cyanobacteria bacterium P01_D01_bin.56]
MSMIGTAITIPKQNPDWAGDSWLSRFVNLLIQTKPLYALMKQQARGVLIKKSQKKGIPWNETVQLLEASDVKTWLPQLSDPAVVYPDYYQAPFHAYDAGNLCWLAAFETAPATYAMPLRIYPELTWEAAQAKLRSDIHCVLNQYGPDKVKNVLDVGCSVGISTQYLHKYYTQRQKHKVRTVGLDLSPYMLSVAKYRDTHNEISEWRHAQAEKTGLPDASFDLVSLQYVIHELPRKATKQICQEAFRLLRKGGSIVLVDIDPKSKVIQSLPPVLSTLMKSTEPWSDDYYTFDVETALKESRFKSVITVACNPRHKVIVATK